MEIPDLGSRCKVATCGLIDFLPIKCPYCAQLHCKDHALPDAHQCPDVTVTTATGSASTSAFRTTCALASCSQQDNHITVPCSSCHAAYCVRHRHMDQHACPVWTAAMAHDPQADARKLLLQHFGSKSQPASDARPAKGGPKKKMPILELMKLKQSATGDARVPMQQRSYHRVSLPPASSSTLATEESVPLYFDAAAVVGKAIDAAWHLTGRHWEDVVQGGQSDVVLIALGSETNGAERILAPSSRLGEVVATGEELVLVIRERSPPSSS
ncbi:hypothetical protein BC828DRAFT_48156 [Blastocladiella britannica]|nr:hypothetical protein BC828DRAFT_48156 [Blastocladiella britannica]